MDPNLVKKPAFSLFDGASGVYGIVLVMVYGVVVMVVVVVVERHLPIFLLALLGASTERNL